MAETIRVPLEGANVTPHGDNPVQPPAQPERETNFKDGVYQPPSKRVSIHQIRMPRTAAVETETAPQWTGSRFEYKPVERRAEPEPSSPPPQSAPPNDAISQQISELTNAVELLARHQLGLPPDDSPQMPNAAAYDFYDPVSEGEYYQAMREYMDAEWQRRKQTELEPYKPALDDIQKGHEMRTQVESLQAEHGDNPNFKRTLLAALELVADSGNKLSITDAYAQANNPDNAKPGVRGNSHLPKHLTQGKFPRFGDILLHNQLSGRSGRR